jgi:hypothetical protein
MKDVNEIIKTDGVPLISIKRKGLGNTELDVIKCASHIRYVAISHVWPVRQVGAKRNSLPHCQLQHLDELITKLPKDFGRGIWLFDKLHSFCSNIAWYLRLTRSQYPTNGERLFWLDTLCIPLPAESGNKQDEQESLRQKAISKKDLVYAGADSVLVLDLGLLGIQGGSKDIWTVGESVLPSAVVKLNAPQLERIPEILA